MNTEKKEILEYNKEIEAEIDSVINKLEEIDLSDNKDLADKINKLISFIKTQNSKFQEVIKDIESNSEFDKLCISFFGNTNAGKSTIIESLRVLLQEQEKKEVFLKKLVGIIDDIEENIIQNDTIIANLNSLIKQSNNKAVRKVFGITIVLLLTLGIGITIGFFFL